MTTDQRESKESRANTAHEWDHYWDDQRPRGAHWTHSVYDRVARFYRLRVIQPSFLRILKSHFRSGARVLHAGCGGGEVDAAVVHHIDVTAMDFSFAALQRYASVNGDATRRLLGDVRAIPASSNAFEGVYNLGVMEHFSDREIEEILVEFHRVLKPGGRLVLFWPPQYGLSVIALKGIHLVLRHGLRRRDRLHPDEPNLLRSRQAATRLFAAHGFTDIQVSFGARDLWTYCVIAGSKPRSS